MRRRIEMSPFDLIKLNQEMARIVEEVTGESLKVYLPDISVDEADTSPASCGVAAATQIGTKLHNQSKDVE